MGQSCLFWAVTSCRACDLTAIETAARGWPRPGCTTANWWRTSGGTASRTCSLSQRRASAEVCEGVSDADLQGDELDVRRARGKADKSLELYKFQVSARYVAMTRAVETLTLLGLHLGEPNALALAKSTQDEWAQEARRRELQGKAEQAKGVRDAFLQHKPVPRTPWSLAPIDEQFPKAFDPRTYVNHVLARAKVHSSYQPARRLWVRGWR